MIDQKRGSHHRVSVVIPAKDEATTIARVIDAILPLTEGPDAVVDELVVIDSDSSDATAAVARAAGARVHAASQIRSDLGPGTGKGEAIWKSMFVTSGDLMVFLDADVTNVAPAFVTGLIAPLAEDDRIALTKAYYDRDLADDHDVRRAQGGRVTELLARPLITLWWPDLTGIAQPLAGEWAIRRSVLESVELPCGYGVEMSVLIDTYLRHGIEAIAQVDLGHREHRHQDLHALSAMSVEILAAVAERLPGGSTQLPQSIAHPVRAGDGLDWATRVVNVAQRPPVVTVGSAPTTR